MTLLHAAVLGAVQGAGELLPISSSAHLILVPWMMRWPDQGLAYDVALHWGTLLALAIVFWKDWLNLAKAGLRREDSQDRRLFDGIVLGTIPGVIAGLAAEKWVESLFRKPEPIAVCLIAFGILLAAADRLGRKEKGFADLGLKECALIGLAQALAIVPGVSRSGITLTAALFMGFRRVEAARFSFLLSVPIVLGAGILKFKDLTPGSLDSSFWTGIVCAAVTGVACIRFLLSYLQKSNLDLFAVYRVLFGGLALFLASAVPPVHPASKLGLSAPTRAPVSALSAEAARHREHVVALSSGIGERSAVTLKQLDRARDEVAARLKALGYDPVVEPYHGKFMGAIRNGTTFYNISVTTGPARPDEGLWVIGAHYDTAYGTPGADDNASGVAVLLELARALQASAPPRRVRLVAFSTEEPPAFGTQNMGSWHDAQSLKRKDEKVEGMISLEMLGYFDERPGSQIFFPFLKWFMPDRGDFLALVANPSSRAFLKKVSRPWRRAGGVRLVARTLPGIQALRLSDHANYWDAGFPALLLTDTANYRNPHYHERTDLPETLDYERLAAATRGLEAALRAPD
ncbi:MAG TPA: undecaprenyl-diphosphatase UppP [Elusimicrobia bacterium]|nr:undecaprenyl-diphosphatase UppP [Elusimicrobiota bacterium]